jgi:hypothetical protein
MFAGSPQQRAAAEAASFVQKFNDVILFPTIALLSGVAFLVFIWGLVEYLVYATVDQRRAQGVQHITWGIIGLFVMITAYTILTLFTASFGLDDELNCAANPTAAGCDSAFQIPSI